MLAMPLPNPQAAPRDCPDLMPTKRLVGSGTNPFGRSSDHDVARVRVKEHVSDRSQARQTEHLFGRLVRPACSRAAKAASSRFRETLRSSLGRIKSLLACLCRPSIAAEPHEDRTAALSAHQWHRCRHRRSAGQSCYSVPAAASAVDQGESTRTIEQTRTRRLRVVEEFSSIGQHGFGSGRDSERECTHKIILDHNRRATNSSTN